MRTFRIFSWIVVLATLMSATFPQQARAQLIGDINGDSRVTIAEVQTAINMFLGIVPQPFPSSVDRDMNTLVSIAEVQSVINSFLGLNTYSNDITSVEAVSGDNQTAIVGTDLPDALVAIVKNSGGQPVSGVTVNFRVVTGGGAVFAGAATSDAGGYVRERWTLGTVAGPQKVELRGIDSSGNAVVYATFNATAIAASPQIVKVLSGNAQSAKQLQALPLPVKAVVTDTYGNATAGVSVTFTANNGGTALPSTAISDTAGEVSATWTLGAAYGTQTLNAVVAGLPPATFSATATFATPTVAKTSGDLQEVPQYSFLSQPLQVRIADAEGNPYRSPKVIFSTTTASGYTSSINAATDSGGVASTADGLGWLYFSTPGKQTVIATDTQGGGSTEFTVNVTAPNPSHPFDGFYSCTPSSFPFEGRNIMRIVNGVVGPLPQEFRFGVSPWDGTLDETSGTYSGSYPTIEGAVTLSGKMTVVSEGHASGAGTWIEREFPFEPTSGTWSCNRQ